MKGDIDLKELNGFKFLSLIKEELKINYDEELSQKMNSQKEQKLSFQTDDTLDDTDNAKFILTRVKYSINTIIKHLNSLTRSNFLTNQTDSTEDFIKGLNKMIKLEGFSEMLKENKTLEHLVLYDNKISEQIIFLKLLSLFSDLKENNGIFNNSYF